MRPEEILAMSMAPAMNAVNSYADGQVVFNALQYRNAMDQSEQATRINAATVLEGMRENAAMARQNAGDAASMERTKEQIAAYASRLDEVEKQRITRDLIRDGHYPKPSESFDQFIVRASTEKQEKEDKVSRQAAAVLEGFDDQVKTHQEKIDAEETKYKGELTKAASDYALRQFQKSGEYTAEDKAAIAKLGNIPIDVAISLYASKNPRGVELQGLLDGLKSDGLAYASQVVQRPNLKKWEDQKNSVAIKANQFLMTKEGQLGHSRRLLSPTPKPTAVVKEETQEEEDPMAKLARTLMVEKPAAPPTAPPAPSGETQVKTPGWSSVGLGVVPSFPSGILNRPASAMATLMFGGGDEPVAPATKQTNAADVFSLPTPSIQHLFNAPKPIVAGAFARRPTVGAGDLKVVERDTPLPEFDPFLVPGINEISKWDNYGGHAPGNYEPRLNPLDDEPIDGALTPSQHGELLRVIVSDPRYRTRESVEKLADFIRSEGYRGPRPAELRNRAFRRYAPPAIDPNLTFQAPQ